MSREHRQPCNWLAFIVLLFPLSALAQVVPNYFLEDGWVMHKESDTYTDGKLDTLTSGNYLLFFNHRGVNKGWASFRKRGYYKPRLDSSKISGRFRLYDKYIIFTRGNLDSWSFIQTEQQACIIEPATDKKSMTLSGCDFAGTWLRESEVAKQRPQRSFVDTIRCNPVPAWFLLIAAYSVAAWLLLRSFITRCLAALGKPFPRFAFGFTFVGLLRQDLSDGKYYEMPLWGMTDEDMKVVIAYRKKWRPYSIALTMTFAILMMLVLPNIMQITCRS